MARRKINHNYYKELFRLKIYLKVNFSKGVYICPICKKEMPMIYYTTASFRKRITTHNLGIPKANAFRHLIACSKKKEEIK